MLIARSDRPLLNSLQYPLAQPLRNNREANYMANQWRHPVKRINVKILVMYLIAIGINCMFILKGNAADLKCMANYKDPLTKQKVSEKIADVADDLDSTSACAKACKKFEEENPDAQLVYCHNRT